MLEDFVKFDVNYFSLLITSSLIYLLSVWTSWSTGNSCSDVLTQCYRLDLKSVTLGKLTTKIIITCDNVKSFPIRWVVKLQISNWNQKIMSLRTGKWSVIKMRDDTLCSIKKRICQKMFVYPLNLWMFQVSMLRGIISVVVIGSFDYSRLEAVVYAQKCQSGLSWQRCDNSILTSIMSSSLNP